MAESHVVTGLVAKRAELAGLVDHHKKQLARLGTDLSHLDAAIKLFAPEIDLGTLRPKRHRIRNIHFLSGERPRRILDELRQAGAPLTARQLAERIIAVKGLPDTPAALADTQKTLIGALGKLAERGVVNRIDDQGTAYRWAIA